MQCNGRLPCHGCGKLKNIICLYSRTGRKSLPPIGLVGPEAVPVPSSTGSARAPPGFVPIESKATGGQIPWLSASSPLQSGTGDPFAASVIPLTAADHGLIILWRDWFVHKLWPCDDGVDYLPVLSQWSTLVSLAISRSSCAHALNAAISLSENRRPTPVLAHRRPTGDKKSAIKHAALAISALECDISVSITDIASVFTIWLLTSAALDFGDYEIARIHLTGAKALLEDGGGLSTLPDVLQMGLIEDDLNLSMHSSLQPIFKEEHWDPGDISWALRPSVLEQIYSSEYLCTPLSDRIPARLRQIFRPYQQICAIRQYALTICGSARRTELIRWADLRLLCYFGGVQRRRCKAYEARKDSNFRFDAQDTFESCIRIVLNYVTRMLCHTYHTEQATWKDFEDIADSLCHRQVRSLIATDLLLFILAVSAMTEYKAVLANNRPVNSWWHVPRFLVLAHCLHMTSAQAIAPTLHQYVYNRQLNSVLDEIFDLGGPFNIKKLSKELALDSASTDAGDIFSDTTWNRTLVIKTAAVALRAAPKPRSRYHHDHLYYRALMTI
jgi:hypothetical protein